MTASTTRRTLLALAASAACLPQVAGAAAVTVQLSLDTANVVAGLSGFTGGSASSSFSPAYNVTLAEGDSFDFKIDFVGNQTLTINSLSFIWAFSFSGAPVSGVTGTGTFSFLDTAGNVILTSNSKTDTETSVHFGQQFLASDFVSLPSSITFGGMRYQGVLVDYVEAGVTSREYNAAGFFFNAETFTADDPGTVPEPASLLLSAAALGALGWARKRRKV